MHEQTITFSVDAGLKDAFTHVAAKNACTDTQLLKAFMAEYVQQDARQQQYDAWFISKVEAGLHELQEGKVLSHEEANSQVEAFKATLRSAER